MPPPYIRPDSLSPPDLSLVLLSSPTEISKLYPCALLISHHSGARGPRVVWSSTVLSSSLSLLNERASTPDLT